MFTSSKPKKTEAEFKFDDLRIKFRDVYHLLDSSQRTKSLQITMKLHEWGAPVKTKTATVNRADMNEGFKRCVRELFATYLNQYEMLKADLIAGEFMSEDELDEIEQTVLKAALGYKLRDLIYFDPARQERHETAYKKYKETYVVAWSDAHWGREDLVGDEWEGESVKEERDLKFYHAYLAGLVLFPVFGIGLVVLIVTALVDVIDRIYTPLRVKAFDRQMNTAIQNLHNHVHPLKPELDAEIQNNPSDRIKQGFFTVAKARLNPRLKQYDENYPELHKAGAHDAKLSDCKRPGSRAA